MFTKYNCNLKAYPLDRMDIAEKYVVCVFVLFCFFAVNGSIFLSPSNHIETFSL